MSLSIWLPLNGTDDNKGTEFAQFTSYSVTNSTGKVTHNAYSFNGSSSHVDGNISLTTNMTFACWVKFNGTNGYHIIDCRAQSGETGYQPMYAGTNYGLQCYSSNGGSYTWNAATCGFTTGVWYHLCVTISATNSTLYINGESKGTQSGTFGYDFGTRLMRIGTRCSGANWFNGIVNDVRVYNHVLSTKEIKELAKGLCLHYKFNFEDLYQPVDYIQSSGSQRIKLNITPTSQYKIESVFAVTNTAVTSAIWCARGSSTGSYSTTAFYIANSGIRCDYGVSATMTNIGSLTANTKHTLLMDSNVWYLDGVQKTSMTAATFTAGSAIQLFASHYNGMDSNLGNYAQMKLYSFTVWDENRNIILNLIPCVRRTDSVVGLYDIVKNTFYTNNGSGTFSYAPTVSDTLTIIDNSGYGNTGTLSSSASASNDTPIGNSSLYLNNVWCRAAAKPPLYMPQMSIFMWIKQPSPTTQRFLFGTFNNWTANGIGWWVDSGGTNMSNLVRIVEASSYSSGTAFTNVCDENWHHIGITWDGSNYKTYKDGELLGSVTLTSGQIYNPDYIFGGGNYNNEKMQGYMADARLYATALTQSDITELYKTKESIDKDGNLYCNSYNEFWTKIDFSKKSIIHSNLLSEGLDKVSLQSSFTQLEYLQSSGTQHINTGLNFNLNTGWYEVKAQPTTASQNGFILGDWTVSNNYYWLYHYQSGSTIRMYATNSANSQVNFTTGLTSSNTNAHTYYYKNKTMYVDGTEQSSQTSVTFSTPTGNCWLFKASGSSATGYPYKGRIYYAKFWMNGKLVRWFIPVKKNKDNTLGMLDIVNNVFYPNAGTDTFTAGPQVEQMHNIYTKTLKED